MFLFAQLKAYNAHPVDAVQMVKSC